MATVIDRVRQKHAAAKSQAVGEYRAMVRDAAAGKDIDADAAVEVLDAADRDAEDFARDTEKMERRLAWTADLADEPAAVAEHAKLTADVEKVFAEKVAAVAKFDAKIAGIQLQIDAAVARLERVVNAKAKLASPDTQVWAGIPAKAGQARSAWNQLAAKRDAIKRNLKLADAAAGMKNTSSFDYSDSVKLATAEAARLRTELAGVLAEIAAAEADMSRIEAEMQAA